MMFKSLSAIPKKTGYSREVFAGEVVDRNFICDRGNAGIYYAAAVSVWVFVYGPDFTGKFAIESVG
jgi:hypothetical protein